MLTLRTGLTHEDGLLAKDGKPLLTLRTTWLTYRTGTAFQRQGKARQGEARGADSEKGLTYRTGWDAIKKRKER